MQPDDPLADLGVDTRPPSSGSGLPWILVALLVVVGGCLFLVLVAVVVIVILAILGPAIGNIFSNTVMNL